MATNTNSTNVTVMSACDLHSSLNVSLTLGTGYSAMLILVHYHAVSKVLSVQILMVLSFRFTCQFNVLEGLLYCRYRPICLFSSISLVGLVWLDLLNLLSLLCHLTVSATVSALMCFVCSVLLSVITIQYNTIPVSYTHLTLPTILRV